MSAPVIGFAGMTHLGLNSAAAAAEKGFQVICYDPDPGCIAALAEVSLPFVEPGLSKLIKKNVAGIKFSSNPRELIHCDLVYIAPDVPTDDFGQSNLVVIDNLIDQIEPFLREDAVMIILSQVPPGFTRARLRSGHQLYYQVETLIFGCAVQRALYPERFIIGCNDPKQPLPHAFRQFLEKFDCPILPMRYESAELAKISINMCLVATVSVANTLAELCENICADWSEIVPALKLDKRIGQYSYLTPGLGIAGGNLERDLATVCSFGDRYGTDVGVVRALISNSTYRKDWPWRMLKTLVLDHCPDARITLLGLAYKADTSSTKNSPALALLAQLQDRMVTVYDPVVPVLISAKNVVRASSALEAVQGADAVCVMTPWEEFKSLELTDLVKRMRGCLLIDPFCIFNDVDACSAGLDYITLGVAAKIGARTC